MWPRRSERLDDASASFSIFFSQDGIFLVPIQVKAVT
jgi:hypothetical protein